MERRVKALGADADDASKEKGGVDKVGIEQNVPGTNIHAAAGETGKNPSGPILLLT